MSVTVLSIDYNNCGDALIIDCLEEGPYKDFQNHPNVWRALAAIRLRLLSKISEAILGSREVMLNVGSLRQSPKSDIFEEKQNKNGRCFSNYAKFATLNKWRFNRLLLSDYFDEHCNRRKPPFESGTMMGQLRKNLDGSYAYENDPITENLAYLSDPTKVDLLLLQLQDAAKTYPNELINFVFFNADDNKRRFQILREYFDPAINPGRIPPNVKLTIVECNYLNFIKTCIKETKAIPSDKLCIEAANIFTIHAKFVGCKKAINISPAGVNLLEEHQISRSSANTPCRFFNNTPINPVVTKVLNENTSASKKVKHDELDEKRESTPKKLKISDQNAHENSFFMSSKRSVDEFNAVEALMGLSRK